MLRWSSVRRRSSYWEPAELKQRYEFNQNSSLSNDHRPASARSSFGYVGQVTSVSPKLTQRRFRRASTMNADRRKTENEDENENIEVPPDDPHQTINSFQISSNLFNKKEKQRRYSLWTERYSLDYLKQKKIKTKMIILSKEENEEEENDEFKKEENLRKRMQQKRRRLGLQLFPKSEEKMEEIRAVTIYDGAYCNVGSPLLSIDADAETEAEEEEQRCKNTSLQTELLPRLPKSRSKYCIIRRSSFCENEALINKEDEEISKQNGLLTVGISTPPINLGEGGRRPSMLQTAAAIMRRRRSSFVRERWANKLEFLLAVIGYAVDLGNIWRFPSVCYKHGGVISWWTSNVLYGISTWTGIGYGICFICTFIACFYNAIIAHAVYFFISSVGWEVPWLHCNNSWNTLNCRETLNTSLAIDGQEWRTPSQEFYIFSVLESHKSTGLNDLGGVKPSMAFCLFLVFLIVYFALWKGPQSTGKIVWVTATAPYIVLTILLIRGLTLPGAYKGIYYYLTPDFDKLKEPEVWTAAATQIFFSLGPGFGVLLALSSYNDFNNNCYRDALVTSLINCFTSFFSGFVIFSTLGYMSELTNRPVSEVVGEDESSLIFVVYPQAIATMDYSPIWSLIFFLMLITLGIDSTGGRYVIPFLDDYGVSLSVLFIVMCEMIAVCWFYGIKRFSEDIHVMLGFYPGIYWRVCWTCCPVFIGFIFLISLYSASFMPKQLNNYTYPWWSVSLGWLFRMLSCLSIPVYAIYMFITTPGPLIKRLRIMLTAQQRGSIVSSAPSTMNIGGINNNNISTNLFKEQNNLTLLRFSDNIPSTINSRKESQVEDNDSIAHL
uniref:Transporter n=1 Tax=Meloidogyne hapla TaxID=6305 RepID=A0A1I8B250_MELHA